MKRRFIDFNMNRERRKAVEILDEVEDYFGELDDRDYFELEDKIVEIIRK